LDGSDDGEINAMDVSGDGQNFVSAGEDKLVKIWGYDDGLCNFVGIGHSGPISKVKFLKEK